MDTGDDNTCGGLDRQPGRLDMGIELVVFATIFTLIVLLTGGPGNTL